MKEIGRKEKYIFIGVGFLFIVGIFFYTILPHVIYQGSRILEEAGQEEWAKNNYENISDKYSDREIALKAQIEKIQLIIENNNLDYFSDRYTDTGTISGISGYTVGYRDIETINETYHDLKEIHHSNKLWGEYTLGVAIMNWFAGNWQKAIELLEDGTIVYDEEVRAMKELNLAAMYLNIGYSERAEGILDSIEDDRQGIAYLSNDLLAYSNIMQNDIIGFRNRYEREKDRSERNQALYQINNLLIQPVKDVDAFLWSFDDQYKAAEKNKGTNTVKGTVTMEGRPMAGVIIYLVAAPDWGTSHSGAGVPYCDYMTFTDEKGEYSINNVLEGGYMVGFHGDWQRVQGKNMVLSGSDPINIETGDTTVTRDISFHESIQVKVTDLGDHQLLFQWDEKIPVDHYIIHMGELFESEEKERAALNFNFYSEKIMGNEYILDMKTERKNKILRGYVWHEKKLDVHTALDPLYHEGEYAYEVIGYKGNEIITSSIGISPNAPHDNIYVQGEAWSTADKLILESKYEEALLGYEKELEEDPNNVHAIKMLATFYENGWEMGDDWNDSIGQDLEKAIYYYEKLEQLLSKKEEVWNRLGFLYKEQEEYNKAISYYEKLIDLDSQDPYYYQHLGDIYRKQGELQKAKKMYHKGYEIEPTTGLAEELILVDLLMDDIEELKKVGGKVVSKIYYTDYPSVFTKYDKMDRSAYTPFYDYIKKGDLELARDWLQSKEDDLANLYRGIFIVLEEMKRKEEENKYKELYHKVKDVEIKKMMKYIGRGNIHSGFGL